MTYEDVCKIILKIAEEEAERLNLLRRDTDVKIWLDDSGYLSGGNGVFLHVMIVSKDTENLYVRWKTEFDIDTIFDFCKMNPDDVERKILQTVISAVLDAYDYYDEEIHNG